MKTLFTLVVVVGVGLAGAIGFAYTGLYDVAASSPHSGFLNWLLSTTSHASVERRARDIEVPNLERSALILAGVNDFKGMCAGCHGAPGQDPEAMGQGLNPPAPDLAETAAEMTAAELFWITKNGIKMTGMPAWGASHDDDALWPVVAFLTQLPNLDAAGYQRMLTDAQGLGHHADDVSSDDHATHDPEHHGHDSNDHPLDEPAQGDGAPQAPEEHDHSTHQH
jgi:mono/diheme cytochrome c family protein